MASRLRQARDQLPVNRHLCPSPRKPSSPGAPTRIRPPILRAQVRQPTPRGQVLHPGLLSRAQQLRLQDQDPVRQLNPQA